MDAKSCYDCMTRQVVLQACSKFGTPTYFCIWMYKLLTKQKHHIITTNVISKATYGTTKQQEHHGIGQGSMAAPIIWLLISTILLQSMRTWAQGVTWESPDRQTQTCQVADVYVDDATLWTNGIPNPKRLVQRMEQDLNQYQEHLRWTGGH